MEWITDPTSWFGLGTLIMLELVLGIDNLIFIAILVDRLPPAQRDRARIIGLSLALLMRVAMLAGISWLQTLTTPLFSVFGIEITVRGIILIAGGLFLLVKATTELHARLEGVDTHPESGAGHAIFWQAIVQIIVLDAVFSLDSVITAVGMVDDLAVMVIAVVVAIALMMLMSGPLTNFVTAHPSVVILCLSFLLTIGFSLFVEGFGLKIPKGYLYTAIAFSIMIEALNQVARTRQVRRAAKGNLRSRTAEAVLRVLGGTQAGPPSDEGLSSIMAAGNAADVFAPSERMMVQEVLSLADRPIRSMMTPLADAVWLDVSADARSLAGEILRTAHAAYPVCRDDRANFLGIARAPDLLRDILEKGRIDEAGLERNPLTFKEDGSALEMVEQLRTFRFPMAIVKDRLGAVTGIVTPADILRVILHKA
jgi:predicted tellurium resistance membrane protein TerC/CBS domain-containing protein